MNSLELFSRQKYIQKQAQLTTFSHHVVADLLDLHFVSRDGYLHTSFLSGQIL